MKKIALVLAACLVACGSSSSDEGGGGGTGGTGGSADVAAARAKLGGKPTAELTSGNASRVATGTRESSSAGEGGMAFGGMTNGSSGGGLGTRTIRVLTSSSPLESCADIQADKENGSCACDSGKVDYEAKKHSDDEIDLTLRFAACKTNDRLYEGTLAISLTKVTSETPDAVFAMDAKIDGEPIKTTFAIKDGKIWHAVDANEKGEYVLVELGSYADGDGQYTVHAKNGEFECDLDSGKGTCASEDGDAEIPVEEN